MGQDTVERGQANRLGGAESGTGVLVFVVGPSGSGKDTLLSYARDRLRGREDIRFARRRITRPAEASEDHLPLDEAAFTRQVALGAFPLYWRANGLHYALGAEVAEDIAAGRVVVANGSRAAVRQARRSFANVRLVLVTAPPELLAARIAARGREAGERIEQRLARDPALDAPPDLTIVNDGAVEAAGERLVAFLSEL